MAQQSQAVPQRGGRYGPSVPDAWQHSAGPTIIKAGFLIGGIAYLIGSYLMLPELFTQLRRRRREHT